MATTDTLCFGLADTFVSRNPTIDGLVDYDMLPYHDQPETGYTLGCKLTYEAGGFPRVVFKGVHYTAREDLHAGRSARSRLHARVSTPASIPMNSS